MLHRYELEDIKNEARDIKELVDEYRNNLWELKKDYNLFLEINGHPIDEFDFKDGVINFVRVEEYGNYLGYIYFFNWNTDGEYMIFDIWDSEYDEYIIENVTLASIDTEYMKYFES